MMECINVRIEGAAIVLEVRLNVNALAGTLDDIMNEKSRSIANTAGMFLHELQVKDSVKKLAGVSRVKELQNVEETMKQVLKDAPRAFNDPESFQKANALAVETYKGADSHADLCAQMEALFEDDAGDATLEGEIAGLEARLKRRQIELALPAMERRISALNLWAWVLKPLWVPTFHVLVVCLGLVSAVPAAALACLSVLFSLVARLPLLGALVRESEAAPVAWLSAKAFGFCGECLFMLHIKVYSWTGTLQDRRWVLALLDIERKGLVSAVEALRSELGGDPLKQSLRRGDRWGVGVCLAVALVASVLFIVFSRVQPWGEPAAAGIRCGGDYTTDYPTLMLVVGVLAGALGCWCSGVIRVFSVDDSADVFYLGLLGCFCLCTPLVVTALVMWIYLAQSSPACGIELWVLGYAAPGAGVLAVVCIVLALRALAGGWRAPAPEDDAEIREMQSELRRMWRRGGLEAKPGADRERIKTAARAALARVSTREMSNEHICRFFEHAARHLKEACCELPMRTAHVKYPKPSLEVEYEEDKEGLAWLAGVELLKRGYTHEDMERVLELFALGTRQGEQVLRSSELASEWEASQMAALNVAHESFDGVNLVQLATGKTNKVHLSAVSPIQAAFLAAFVSLHAPGPVAVVLPPPAVRIVLAGRADPRAGRSGGSEGATHGSVLAALLGAGAGDVGGEALDASMMGLEVGGDGECVLKNDKLSLDALRVLVQGALWRYGHGASRAALVVWKGQTPDSPEGVAAAMDVVWAHAQDGGALAALSDAQLRWWGVEDAEVRAAVLERVAQRCGVPVDVRKLDAQGNRGLGGTDGGREAARLLGELLQLMAPRVEELDLSDCGLGGAAAHELALALPHLPRLRYCELMLNDALDPASGQHLRRAWQDAGKPALNVARETGLLLPQDTVTALATALWEALPCFETRKEVQAARAWPAGADEQLVAMARAGRTEAVRALVRRGGASPHAVDRHGESALEAAKRAGHQDVVEALCELSGLHLHVACVRGDVESVRKLLAGGATPKLTDATKMTALAHAIANGHEVSAQILIGPTKAAGALDVQNDEGTTALMHASMRGLCGVVEQLLAAGAKTDVTDANKMTALAHACVQVGRLSGAETSAAQTAAELSAGCWVKTTAAFDDVPKDTLGQVQRIHEDVYAIVDFDGAGETGVLKSDFGKISVLSPDLLVEGKAGKRSLAPQEEVCKRKALREAMVTLLIAPTQAAGALDVPNDEGSTVLMHACKHGLRGVVEQLLAAGAKTDVTDANKMTALAHAIANGHEEVAKMLTGPTGVVEQLPASGAKTDVTHEVRISIGSRAHLSPA
jgi:ankyrin repeat protein